jgi:hypothetical protein
MHAGGHDAALRRPHALGSTAVSTHWPPHCLKRARHWHIPALQDCVGMHVLPHEPQFSGFVFGLMHAVPHAMSGDGHLHTPP